jgi:hypothetical protein
VPECSKCPVGSTPSQDGRTCLACDGSENTFFNSREKQCECTNKGYLKQDFTSKRFSCETCPEGQWRGPATVPIYECIPCQGEGKIYDDNGPADQPYRCVCNKQANYRAAGDICLLDQDVEDKITAVYNDDSKIAYTSQDVLNSDVMKYLYIKSAYGCRVQGVIKDCQSLANLCVLNMYSYQKSVCSLVRSLQQQPGSENPMPKVYYLGDNGPTKGSQILKRSDIIKFRAAFSNSNKEFDVRTKL